MKTVKHKIVKRRLGTTTTVFTPLDGGDTVITIKKNYHTQNCEVCHVEFHSSSPAKTCGFVCRNKASRKRTGKDANKI